MLEGMQLPKINQRKQESRQACLQLRIDIRKSIEKLEKDIDYEFLSYEIDSVLLEMIQDNHRSYLKHKFGADAE